MNSQRTSTVTVTNPDGSTTTTHTRTVETKTESRPHGSPAEDRPSEGGFGGFAVGASPDETGPFPGVDEIPPLEKVVLGTVLEGVEILQKGADYVRRVSKIASLFLAKKD